MSAPPFNKCLGVQCIIVNFILLYSNFVKHRVVQWASRSFFTVRDYSCTHIEQQPS